MQEEEEILQGGENTASVIRIGDVVYRDTQGKHSAYAHAILKQLEAHAFAYSPRFLGIDEKGREMLSYIEGEVPRGIVMSDQQLKACMKILREFHDLNSKSSLCGQHETICHNDFAPWNMIFRNEKPVGVIDFDEVAPGPRVDDVAYFIWTFLDLGVAPLADSAQINKIVMLIDTYQLKDRGQFIEALLKQQERILFFRKNLVKSEQDEEKKTFSKKAVNNIQTAMQWVYAKRTTIESRLI